VADLSDVMAKDLAAYYRMVREQTHQWVDPLSDEQLLATAVRARK
jgi:hypothetical protein